MRQTQTEWTQVTSRYWETKSQESQLLFCGWGNLGNALKASKSSWEIVHLGGHRAESEYLKDRLPALRWWRKVAEGVLNQIEY